MSVADRRRRFQWWVWLVGGLVALWWAAGTAQADTLHCGATVTSNISLANNITNCTGDGIDIGANGLVIRLNGHTISGTPGQTAPSGGCILGYVCTAGINLQGHSGVTIIGGPGSTIANFQDGLFIDGDDNRVDEVLSTASPDSGVLIEGDFNRLLNSVQERNPGDGVTAGAPFVPNPAHYVQNNVISGDTAIDNGGDGIALPNPNFGFFDIDPPGAAAVNPSANTVSDSASSHNAGNGITVSSQYNDTVSDNTLIGNTDAGVEVTAQTSGTTVAANTATRSQQGFEFGACVDSDLGCGITSFRARNNQAIDNQVGYQVGNDENGTLQVDRAAGNTIAGFEIDQANVTLQNNVAGTNCRGGASGGNGIGIEVYNDFDYDYFPGLPTDTLIGNEACGNVGGPGGIVAAGDGIVVGGGSFGGTVNNDLGAYLTSNLTDFNAGDGIYINDNGLLTANVANYNRQMASRHMSVKKEPAATAAATAHQVMLKASASADT